MRVVVVANPRSGSGRGLALAEQACAALRNVGTEVEHLHVGPGLPQIDASPEGAIGRADAVVVAGGDGTVLSVARACIGTGVPLYHLPAGNENLFAREFGMGPEPDRLLRALRRGRISRCDVGSCAWEDGQDKPSLFLLMASVGPDASVCHRLDGSRTRAVGHRAYIGPVLAELAQPALPRVRVWCDGQPVVDGRGMLVVANCRQYALRMNPCPDASTSDGLLDLVFVPADTAIDALAALARLRLRWPGPEVVRARGIRIRIELDSAARVQVDGEAAGGHRSCDSRALAFSIAPCFLPVLDAR